MPTRATPIEISNTGDGHLVERAFHGGWNAGEDVEGLCRQILERNRDSDVTWLHSYVSDDRKRLVCISAEASSPEAIRSHAYRAGLPVDEIVAVADTVLVHPDPQPIAI